MSGLELRALEDPVALEPLRRALAEHLVVFLPDQDLDLDDLERITDLLGGRDVTPFVAPGGPAVCDPGDQGAGRPQLRQRLAQRSQLPPAPPSYTLLHAWEVPPFGGDTVWSNQYLAYETLSRGCARPSTASGPCTRPAWPTGPAASSTRSRT